MRMTALGRQLPSEQLAAGAMLTGTSGVVVARKQVVIDGGLILAKC